MKFSFASTLVVALAAETAVASSWFTKAAYNKWHETELERWLSDHDIPYPTPADRKDLENLVKQSWETNVASPYNSWDLDRLNKQVAASGQQVKKGTEKNKDALIAQVKAYWYETEDQASDAYSSVKDWIFDSWTESSLKAFCDKHGIPVPQPRTRDVLLKTARDNYQTVAKKADQVSSYPGNWLYDSWSDSDLKAWLDERGIPVPQPSARDRMIATVRRNSRVAALQAQASQQHLSDKLLESWSDSQIKEWADKNGIKVPQGSNRNELMALARKHAAKLRGDNVSAKAASAYGAATSSAGNEYARATDNASQQGNFLYAQASSYVVPYVDWVQYQLGLKPNYLSSLSSAAATASVKATGAYRAATDRAKVEL